MKQREESVANQIVAAPRASRIRVRPRWWPSSEVAGQLVLPLIILLLVLAFSLAQPRFLSFQNAQNLSRQAALVAIIAAAQMFPIVSGGFDVSLGSQVAVVSVVTALAVLQFGILPGLAIGIVCGGLLGTINGWVIARYRVSPFVVTLGMLSFGRGLALLITDGNQVFGMPAGFRVLGTGYWGPVPLPVVVAVVLYLVCYFVLEWTRFGRYLYAIGANEEAARISGINVGLYKALAYTAAGLVTSLYAIVLSSRVDSGQPTMGQGDEMISIAAVVIGGVALGGGEGTIWNVVLGTAVMSLLSNGLNLVNVSSYVQLMVIGVVIVAAVVADQWRKRARR